jgi:hypothetical protein
MGSRTILDNSCYGALPNATDLPDEMEDDNERSVWGGGDLVRRGRDEFEGLSQRNWGNPRKFSVRLACNLAPIQPVYLPNKKLYLYSDLPRFILESTWQVRLRSYFHCICRNFNSCVIQKAIFNGLVNIVHQSVHPSILHSAIYRQVIDS